MSSSSGHRRPVIVSHLDSFYEKPDGPPSSSDFGEPPPHAVSPQSAAESDQLLTPPPSPHDRSVSWLHRLWRGLLWSGAALLLFGAVSLVAIQLTPRRPTVVQAADADRGEDRGAGVSLHRRPSNAAWNRRLELAGFIALGIFGFGGLLTATGLLLPSVAPWRSVQDAEDEYDGAIGEAVRSEGAVSEDEDSASPLLLGSVATAAPQPLRQPEGTVSGGEVRWSRQS